MSTAATRDSELPAHLRYTLGIPLIVATTAIAAQITIPLPGTPVPITLQTIPVFLAPIALGAGPGAAGLALYLLLGLCGLPIFADHSFGPGVLFGPTGGYLFGFLLAQPIAARVMNSAGPAWHRCLASIALSHLAIFVPGLLWLSLSPGLTPAEALAQGLWPFLPGDLVKSTIALLAAIPLARLHAR